MVAGKPTAYLLIRALPHYRRESFEAGFKALGFVVTDKYPNSPRPCDVVAVWNRYGHNAMAANRADEAGCPVIVAENGYLGKDAAGKQLYALARDDHNGAGRWPRAAGDSSRWTALNIHPQPWRAGTARGHLLVRAQRGVGTPLMASPRGWHDQMAAQLRRVTGRPVVIREHPARAPEDQPPLEQQLAGAWALVTWASSDAGRALALGYPAFYCAPHHVLAGAMRHGIERIEDPWLGDRLPHFADLAWAQWTVDEIASGVPLRHLLSL